MKDINKTAIIGMGALGLLYGNQIASTLGDDSVSFIADKERIVKYAGSNFTVNGERRTFRMEDSDQTAVADLIIVAVKYNALHAALDTMKNCVGPDTIIISVMNGISSERIIGERFGEEKVLYAVAQGMDAMKFGSALTYTQFGELRLGIRDVSQQTDLTSLTRYFDRAGIAYVTEDDILHRLWGKFMLNVGINQTCMVYETNYSGILTPGKAHDTMIGAMREVIQLAQKEQVDLTEKDLYDYIDLLKTLSPDGVPSMRQDNISHRCSEVEMFAGTVRELAGRYGIKVPVNDWLYQKVKDIEASYFT